MWRPSKVPSRTPAPVRDIKTLINSSHKSTNAVNLWGGSWFLHSSDFNQILNIAPSGHVKTIHNVIKDTNHSYEHQTQHQLQQELKFDILFEWFFSQTLTPHPKANLKQSWACFWLCFSFGLCYQIFPTIPSIIYFCFEKLEFSNLVKICKVLVELYTFLSFLHLLLLFLLLLIIYFCRCCFNILMLEIWFNFSVLFNIYIYIW